MTVDGTTISIKGIMRTPTLIEQGSTLHDALKKMICERTNSLLVVDDSGVLVGELNAAALIHAVVPDYLEDDMIAAHFATEEMFVKEVERTKDLPITEVMYKKIKTIHEDESLMSAAALAISGRQSRLPVVDEAGKPVGVLTRTELKQVIGHYLGIEESFKQ